MRLFARAASALLLASSGAAGQLPEFPFIYAQGEAKSEVSPDVATLTFTLEAFDAEASVATQVVADRSAQVVEICKQQGIPEADVVAFELGKHAVREQSDDFEDLKILGYEVSRTFRITIRQLDKYPTLASAVVGLPNVTEPETAFDVIAREKVEAELIGKACAKARDQAELMATGVGAVLGPVQAVSSTGFGNLEGRFGFAYGGTGASSAGAVPSLFVPSTITVTKSVHVIFRLAK
jgi:uncharacterized protein